MALREMPAGSRSTVKSPALFGAVPALQAPIVGAFEMSESHSETAGRAKIPAFADAEVRGEVRA
jgi:hypothetical protein